MAQKKDHVKISDSPQKKCFIITPIGDENSDIRRKADGLIEAIIRPVLLNLGYEPIIPHTMTKPGSITTQVVESILSVDMVIANLTGLNPNVMYELAVRHAVRKPIVCVVENGTKLPFDIAQDRVIFYSDEFFRVETLKDDLIQMIKAAAEINEDGIDNPIYRAQNNQLVQQQLEKSSNSPDVDINKLILERLTKLEDSVNYINRRFSKEKDYYSFQIEFDNPLNRDTTDLDDSIRSYLKTKGIKASVDYLQNGLVRVMIMQSPVSFDNIASIISDLMTLDYDLANLRFKF